MHYVNERRNKKRKKNRKYIVTNSPERSSILNNRSEKKDGPFNICALARGNKSDL